jgi:lactoylglutathione lyase
MNRLTLPFRRRRFFLIGALVVATLTISIPARSQGPHFNHTTIYVVDLQKSADFYQNVLQLKKIAEPFHDGKHIWMQIGEHAQLHIVSGAKEDIPHDINIHLAFSVPSLEDFLKHLDQANVKYGNWAGNTKAPQVRPDGIKQVYLQDPDGFWIEVNDDKF